VKETEKLDDVRDEIMVVKRSETKEVSDIDRKEEKRCTVIISNILDHKNNAINSESNKKYASSRITRKTPEIQNDLKNCNESDIDFMSVIKQRLSQKNNNDIVSTTSRSKSNYNKK